MDSLQHDLEPRVSVALFLSGDKVLLGLRKGGRNFGGAYWTAPGGKCRPQEPLSECLSREVFEETGITVFRILAHLGCIEGETSDTKVHIFACKTKQTPVVTEPDKFTEWQWHSLHAIPSNFVNPKALPLLRKLAKRLGSNHQHQLEDRTHG